MYSFTEENYLKAIYKLQEKTDDAIHTNSIAKAIDTKAASVTDMIKKLSEKELLNYEKYKGVQLTNKGRSVAVQMVRKHRLWETFLHDKLNFSWDEVHDIAEELEHINSAPLIDKLDEFLNYPTHDPHGDPIPGKNGEIKRGELLFLSDLQLNEIGIMSGVVDHSSDFLKHLQSLNLSLGSSIKILKQNQFDQSLIVMLNNKSKLTITYKVAKNLLIKVNN